MLYRQFQYFLHCDQLSIADVSFLRLCIRFLTSLIAIGSIPASGSSNRIKLGSEAKHLAISTSFVLLQKVIKNLRTECDRSQIR